MAAGVAEIQRPSRINDFIPKSTLMAEAAAGVRGMSPGTGGGGGCSIRALWILNNHDDLLFSRRFPAVEKRWIESCRRDKYDDDDDGKGGGVNVLPSDHEIVTAFSERKKGSLHGCGLRVASSVKGFDSWIDDPITCHTISLQFVREEKGETALLWPLILHIKGPYQILILPLVEPVFVKAYKRMLQQTGSRNFTALEEGFSSHLLKLPCVTGAFSVAHVLSDLVSGDSGEPEVISPSAPIVGGLLDSLTGSIGIPGTRSKPVVVPVGPIQSAGPSAPGALASDILRMSSKPADKETLRSFISSAMPFGTPLHLNFNNILSIKASAFTSSDLPPSGLKLPVWKPYFFRGKQRILFTILETVHAAMYDRDEVPDTISISGQVTCRADLEGLPDLSLSFMGISNNCFEVLSFHACAQVPEQGIEKQAVMFSPPLGNFLLMRYNAFCSLGPPVKGFYQLSMVSEDEGAFLFKLKLMEGYKAPLMMEFCTITMPFPRRKIIFYDGNPSIGTVSLTDHSIEWKLILSGRGVIGKSTEATFPGTVRFSPLVHQNSVSSTVNEGSVIDDEICSESENLSNMVNLEDFLMEKMNKDLPSVDLEESFSWDAYNYAKAAFRIAGGTLSGLTIDPKTVNVYPQVKAPVECSTQVFSGDYILLNTLGHCPQAAVPKR